MIDFLWCLFVGHTLLGFSEKEVGRMTYKKWKRLFDYFKKFHNFKVKKELFDIDIENEVLEQSYEWFDD